jgi:hypothetical protein
MLSGLHHRYSSQNRPSAQGSCTAAKGEYNALSQCVVALFLSLEKRAKATRRKLTLPACSMPSSEIGRPVMVVIKRNDSN